MMVEAGLGAGAVIVGVILAQLHAIRMRLDAQTAAITAAVGVVERLSETEVNVNIDDAVEALQESVLQTIGSMHVPTAADHLFGMVGTFLQAKMMKDLGPIGEALMPPEAQGSVDSHQSVEA